MTRPVSPRPPVVLVVHPGSELYGSDRMVLESVSTFLEAGARVHVALPEAGPLVAEVLARGATYEALDMPVLRKEALRPRGALRLGWKTVRSVRPTVRLLRRLRPDVVYVSTQILPSWLLAGRLAGARTVCHVHEAEEHPSRLVMAGLTAPLVLAHRLVVNSRYAGQILASHRHSLAQRITVVYNGVAGPVRPTPPRSRTRPPLRLAYVGRLSPRKGPDVAVEAARVLRDRGVPVSLALAGGVFPGYEWFEQRLRERAADLVADGTVRFLGFRDPIWEELADADIVLVPSTLPEPFGNTAVEAMLAARPVVVSRSGGLPEAVEGAVSARLVKPGDATALADAVEALNADWLQACADAWSESSRARERFAPSRYRRELADTVLSFVRRETYSGDTKATQGHATIG